MSNPRAEQQQFWQKMAADLDAGLPLLRTLKQAQDSFRGTSLEPVILKMIASIYDGSCWHAALAAHPTVFSREVVALVQAGEAGGVVEVVAERIAAGLAAGTLLLPGETPPPGTHLPRFWRTFSLLLSSGVPIVTAMDVLIAGAGEERLQQAVTAIKTEILAGGTIAGAMTAFPDVFPEGVKAMVTRSEEEGTVPATFAEIATLLEKGEVPPGAPTLTAADGAALTAEEPFPADAAANENAAPVIKFVNLVLYQAIKDHASDIHFDPFENEFRIRYRIDGVLYEMQPPPARLAKPCTNRLKLISGLNIAECRLPQDGRLELRIAGQPYDLRVSTLPTVFGERVVLRVLSRAVVSLELAQLGFSPANLAQVSAICRQPAGLVLCVGAAGTGKTTTLYSLLKAVNDPGKCLVTVEDPVECQLEEITQVPLFPALGLTYPHVVRAMLRQGADVLMVGEVRDLETARLLVEAATTGHLVFSTLHTNNAVETFRRLLDMGLEPHLVNAAVTGVISQRLVRMLCPQCRRQEPPNLAVLPPAAAELVRGMAGPFYVPGGCAECHQTGFRGRTLIGEVLVPDAAFAARIRENADVPTLARAAAAAGMTPLLADGLAKAAQGVTSIGELLRVL